MPDLPPTTSGADRALTTRPLVASTRQAELGEMAAAVAIATPEVAEVDTRGPVARVAGRTRALVRDADPRAIAGPKLPLVVIALSGTIATWDDQALGILGPEIRAEFAFSVAFLVLLGSVMQAMTKLTAIPFGYLADRVARVWMLRIGSIVANVASVFQGLAPGAGMLVGARLTGGLGAAVVAPASFPLLTDYYRPESRTRVFSFVWAGGLLGAVIGPIIVGVLGAAFGWRVAVVTLGALASLVSLAAFLLREPQRGRAEQEAAGLEQPVEPEPPSFAEAYRAMAAITTLRRFWYAAPFTIVAGGGAFQLLNIYYSEVFLLGPGQRGVIAAISAAIGFVSVILFGPMGDRVLQARPARLVAFAAGITLYQGFSYAVLAFAPNVVVAVAVGLPAAVVATILTPAFLTMISVIVPPRMRGLGLQTQAPWELIGLIATPILAAAAIDALGLKLGFVIFALPLIPAAAIIASTASHIERDIDNARAEALAEAEVRRLRDIGDERLLLVRGLEVAYDGVQVLFGVDLDVAPGELVALLGTNGAGKSTVLRAILGSQDPTGGAIFLEGRDITHLPAHETVRQGVAMVPGGRAVFPDLTVDEHLDAAGWAVPDLDDAEARRRRADALTRFPALPPLLDRAAGTLSGGEQQQVGLAMALIQRPRLLLIDELSLGLAPQVVEQLLEVLRELHASGMTIVVVEQSLNVAAAIADRAVFLDKGEVRFDGPIDDLLSRPDLVRSVFIGGGGGAGGGAGGRRSRAVRPPVASSAAPVLQGSDLAVSFGGVQALRGVSIAVAPGEIVGVIGPNGAGKTTLFDVLSGFVAPDRGTVTLSGLDVTAQRPDARARAGLGRSFQNARLFPNLTVREAIAVFLERDASADPISAALGLPHVRRSEEKIAERVDGLIELLHLEAFADKYVGELSTGSRRIVDVAGVLALRPKVLLLDEPTSGLAQAETEALGPLLQRIVRDLGCGLIVIEHDVPLVSSVADRLVAVELGRDIATGTPDEVIAHPEVVRAYLSATEETLTRSGTRSDRIARALTGSDPT